MSQAITFDSTPTLSATSCGVGSLLRVLTTAVVLVAACGLLATAAFDRSADGTGSQRPIPAPAAAPVAAAADDPSVPDASTVFNSRGVGTEVPVPTL